MRTLFIATVLLLTLAPLGWYLTRGYDQADSLPFIEAYGAYRALADTELVRITAPGSEDTAVRARIHEHLTVLLVGEVSAPERLDRAQRAAADLAMREASLMQITEIAPEVLAAREAMEARARELPAPLRPKADELLAALAERRSLVTAITSELMATFDQTAAIVARIIEEEGVLTSEHIGEINQQTGDAEERFDALTEHYATLEALTADIDRIEAEFIALALG